MAAPARLEMTTKHTTQEMMLAQMADIKANSNSPYYQRALCIRECCFKHLCDAKGFGYGKETCCPSDCCNQCYPLAKGKCVKWTSNCLSGSVSLLGGLFTCCWVPYHEYQLEMEDRLTRGRGRVVSVMTAPGS